MKFTLYTSDYAGKPQNTVYPNEVVIASADDMKKAVSFDHVCAKYKNSRRSNDNFISSDVVSLECDNDHSDKPDEWITPKMLEDELSGVNFVIVSSRHNMKPKGKKSARPRFHMFFPADTCSDTKDYAELKQQIYKEFPFFDSKALDAARFYFGCQADEILWHEGDMSIEEYLFFMQDSVQAIPQGQRNNTLSRFAGRAVKRFGATDKAYEVFQREASKCEPPLSDEELESIWHSACRFAKKVQSQKGYISPEEYEKMNSSLKPDDYSDIGQARVVAREYGDELMHTSATDILRYNGSFWEESRQKAVGAVIEFLDLQLADAEQQYADALQALVNTGLTESEIVSGGKKFAGNLNEEQAKLYNIFLSKRTYLAFVMKRRDMKYILSAMQALKPMIDCPVAELDSDPYLLNTPSATFDVRLGLLGELNHDPAHKITKVTAFDPSDKGKELWLDALDEFFCKDNELIEYVQRMMGLSILGKVFIEALLILYGEGGNGKSTFGNAVLKSLGRYGGVISADALTVGCKRNVKPELAEAKGKRILIAAELEEGMRLNTSIVKQLCSTDEIEAEKKYKDPFHFTPTHTLLLYTNHLPKIGATDDGIWRRLIVIPFNAKIKPKKDIKNYADYLVENAGEYIIKWLIEGAEKIINADFRIDTPQCVQDAIGAYRTANDWLAHFIDECCEAGTGLEAKSGELYQEYRAFCLRTGEYTRSTADFYSELEKRGFKKQRKNNGRYIRGLKIKDTDDFTETT